MKIDSGSWFQQYVYEQLLRAQIQKAKKTVNSSLSFALLGSVHVKTACKTWWDQPL